MGIADLDCKRLAYAPAERSYERAVGIFESLSDRTGEARARARLARVLLRLGDEDGARQSLERAEHLFREANDLTGMVEAMIARIAVETGRGRFREGRRVAWAACSLLREMQDGERLAEALITLGRLELEAEDAKAAELAYREAAAISKPIGHLARWANATWGIAESLCRLGRLAESLDTLDALWREYENVATPLGVCSIHWTRGKVLTCLGQLEQADQELTRALGRLPARTAPHSKRRWLLALA